MSRRPAKKNRITFTLYSTGSTTKVLAVDYRISAAEKGEDDDFAGCLITLLM